MHQPDSSSDDLDRLLTRFYQAELPAPWPGCPATEEAATVKVVAEPFVSSRSSSWRDLSQRFASRFALALSLAVLLCGAWLLSGSFTAPLTPAIPSAPRAQGLPLEIGPGVAERGHFKVTENFVQPREGATRIEIEIFPDAPPAPR